MSDKVQPNYVLGFLGSILTSDSKSGDHRETAKLAINCIQQLEEEIKTLNEKIEKMRNCNNCYNSLKYRQRYYDYCPKDYAVYICDKWELENE